MQNIKVKNIKKTFFLLAGIFFIAGIYYPLGKAITTEIYFTRFELYLVEFFIFVAILNFLFLFFDNIFLKIAHIFFNSIVFIWIFTYMKDILNLNGTIQIGGYFFVASCICMVFAYLMNIYNKKIK
ncbi:MAG: hypothetical protein EAZ44_03025 [Cytophagia bacterium]|nr:MAG: hypothetical protein EAZ44_03025 [Cytophagia bacterium]TAG39908.1 MAG: hypothetical protein EAZ31_08820 [Cytophagia bacterium]